MHVAFNPQGSNACKSGYEHVLRVFGDVPTSEAVITALGQNGVSCTSCRPLKHKQFLLNLSLLTSLEFQISMDDGSCMCRLMSFHQLRLPARGDIATCDRVHATGELHATYCSQGEGETASQQDEAQWRLAEQMEDSIFARALNRAHYKKLLLEDCPCYRDEEFECDEESECEEDIAKPDKLQDDGTRGQMPDRSILEVVRAGISPEDLEKAKLCVPEEVHAAMYLFVDHPDWQSQLPSHSNQKFALYCCVDIALFSQSVDQLKKVLEVLSQTMEQSDLGVLTSFALDHLANLPLFETIIRYCEPLFTTTLSYYTISREQLPFPRLLTQYAEDSFEQWSFLLSQFDYWVQTILNPKYRRERDSLFIFRETERKRPPFKHTPGENHWSNETQTRDFWLAILDECLGLAIAYESFEPERIAGPGAIKCLCWMGTLFEEWRCPLSGSSLLSAMEQALRLYPLEMMMVLHLFLESLKDPSYTASVERCLVETFETINDDRIAGLAFMVGQPTMNVRTAMMVLRNPKLRTLRPRISDSLRRDYCFFMLKETVTYYSDYTWDMFQWLHEQDLFHDHPERLSFSLTPLAANGALDVIKILAGLGVNVSRLDEQRRSPLMMACRGQHTNCVAWLVENKADLFYPGFEDGGMNPFRIVYSSKDEKFWSVYVHAIVQRSKASRLPLLERLATEDKSHPRPNDCKMMPKLQSILSQALAQEKNLLPRGSSEPSQKAGGKKRGKKKGKAPAHKSTGTQSKPVTPAQTATEFDRLLDRLREFISTLQITEVAAEVAVPAVSNPSLPTAFATLLSSETSLQPEEDINWPQDDHQRADEEAVAETMPAHSASFEDAPWEIVLTDKARRQWSNLDPLFQEEVRKKLLVLAYGHRSISVSKRIVGVPSTLKLYESKFSKKGRILWEEAVDFSYRHASESSHEGGMYTDLIRVWFIVPDHDQVARYIRQCEQSHRAGLNGRITRAMIPQGLTATHHSTRSAIAEPRLYTDPSPATSKEVEQAFVFPPASAVDDVDEDKLCSIEKFYSLSEGLAKNITSSARSIEKGQFDYPFRVSEVEYDIIKRSSTSNESTLLIGRSGTGKTTCALYRMWFQYLHHHQQHTSTSNAPLRQLFVTANPVLRGEMNRIFDNLRQAHFPPEHAIYFTSEERARGQDQRPHTFLDVSDKHYPLFLSSREWVLMLDGSLLKPFFDRTWSGSLREAHFLRQGSNEAHTLLLSLRQGLNGGDVAPLDVAPPSTKRSPREEIDCEYFVRVIWPRIKPSTQVPLDPSLVFTEIFSFIKGSAESLLAPDGHLSREQYLKMGKKRAGAFLEARDIVYDVFEKYEDYKRQQRWTVELFDWMDVVHHVYHQLADHSFRGSLFDLIIHDEVQDATQAELSLYFLVSRDANSMFFTGDTCQTIARGISFRFADLRSLFHYRRQSQPHIAVPPLMHLVRNYRSHAGITNMSSAVVELMKFFSPTSFDSQLPRDQGILQGEKPLLIQSTQLEHLLVLLYGNQRSEEVDFGADQVILVMNQSAKAKLSPALKRNALCLTVFEAKGLEFNDVLLFNFFSDSNAENNWRAIDEYEDQYQPSEGIDLDGRRDSGQGKSKYWTHQEQTKSLAHELKFLYTAITRARENIWIYDADLKARQPIFRFFERRELANLLQHNGSASQRLLDSRDSDPVRWRQRGDKLLHHKLYEAAEQCYRKSGDTLMARYCQGHHYLERALSDSANPMLFLQAAEAFLDAKEWNLSATCLMRASAFDVARILFTKIGEHQRAAECSQLCN